jgi:signal transduction histidine kinase
LLAPAGLEVVEVHVEAAGFRYTLAYMERLDILARVIQEDHEIILRDWKARVRQLPKAQRLDRLTLEDHFRSVLDEISTALFQYQDTGTIPVPFTPIEHGRQRFEVGFDVHEVVIEYSILRQVLRECATRHDISLDGVAGAILHQILDGDIASAVATHTEYVTAQRDAEIDERLADVVHNLKTPLAAIQSASHILQHRMPAESKRALSTILDIVIRNCENLNTMVTKLLDKTSRTASLLPSELKVTNLELRVLVADVIQMFSPLAENTGVSILNDVPAALQVTADPLLLKQVLQNLLSNALAYTEQGHISVGGSETPQEVRFWVRDTGSGILPEKLPHVFNRGEGDPLRPESSGLGLAIVKKIVDAHRGTITVESEPGSGSAFTVSLPRGS